MPHTIPPIPLPDRSRGELLDALRRRDEDTWAAFVDWTSRVVYLYGRKHGLGDADAQGIVQDVLVAVVKGVDAFRPDGKPRCFRRWILTIARSKRANLRRQRRPQPLDPEILKRLPDQHAPGIGDELAAEPWLGSRRILLERARAEMQGPVGRALELMLCKGWTAREAAAAVGMRPGAMRAAKRRFLGRLRHVLGQADKGRGDRADGF
ncbi:MAG TPA: sigma factor [Gemmataceae bacterium]|nr:sigma factor [Gemmataceae bacterium]